MREISKEIIPAQYEVKFWLVPEALLRLAVKAEKEGNLGGAIDEIKSRTGLADSRIKRAKVENGNLILGMWGMEIHENDTIVSVDIPTPEFINAVMLVQEGEDDGSQLDTWVYDNFPELMVIMDEMSKRDIGFKSVYYDEDADIVYMEKH